VGNMQPPNVKVLSHSSPYGGQRGVLANVFALLLAACVLLLLPGCRNLFQPPNTERSEAEPGSGTLLLTIHGQSVGRTVRPEITFDCFDRFDLLFVDAYYNNNYFYVEDWDLNEIELYVGIWDLYVTAFLHDGTDYLEAARGGFEYIEVLVGETVDGDIELSPIGTGSGTFNWQISFLYGVMADIYSARMEIWYGAIGGTLRETIVFISGGVSDEPLSGSRNMPAGQYFVVFEILDDDGGRVGVNEALHIFHNMESHVERDFTPDDFPVSLLDLILGSWDDNNDQWNFADRGIGAGHFDHLGINGVYGTNFNDTYDTGIIWWFNLLSSAYGPPTIKAELRNLVDAALIGIGRGTIAAGVHSDQAAALTAIIGLMRYNTSLYFQWAGNLVTVIVGAYRLPQIPIITFLPPPPPQPPPNSPLADHLEWLRNHAAPGSSHTIIINYTDITSIAAQLPTVAGVTITLRGEPGIISLPGGEAGSLFTIENGVTLVLDNIELHGTWPHNTDVLVRVRSGGTLVMNGGVIRGNSGQYGFDGGGGVHVEAGGRFDMHGGTISYSTIFRSVGDDAPISGGVTNFGIFNMHGGRIERNSSPRYGGGVYVGSDGVFNMHGGYISGNISNHLGGGVYVHYMGTFRMENGTIYGNAQPPAQGGNAGDGAALSTSGTAQRGTFTDGVFTPIDDLSSTDNTITVSNGNLIAGP